MLLYKNEIKVLTKTFYMLNSTDHEIYPAHKF